MSRATPSLLLVRVICIAFLSLTVSCVAEHDVGSRAAVPATGAGDTAAGARQTSIPDSSAKTESGRDSSVAVDTVRPHLITGRKKHDSVAFASTVAFGRRMAKNWPTLPPPVPGSILPANRIVAFYGNPLSKRMGVLGEYPVDEMLMKLDDAVRQWQRADP